MPVTEQELEQFHRFVQKRLHNGAAQMTLEETLKEFRAYQKEVSELYAELQESIEQVRRGEAEPLDVDALKEEIRERICE